MDLIHTPKGLRNFRKTGVPYDSKSCMENTVRNSQEKVGQVPTRASASGEPRHTSVTELPPYATAPRHWRIFTIDFTDHTVRSMHTFGDRGSH